MNRIFLIGFMGSGKSTLGNALARELQLTFIETDTWIEQLERKSISQIFADSKEPYFRKKEADFLHHLQLVDHCVIATGGGMPCYADNMEWMNQLGTTVWLDVDENILIERLEGEKNNRPLLSGAHNLHQTVHQLLEDRKWFYKKAAYQLQNPTMESLLSALAPVR